MKGSGVCMDGEINQSTSERMQLANNICFYILYSKYKKKYVSLSRLFLMFRRLRVTGSSQQSGSIFEAQTMYKSDKLCNSFHHIFEFEFSQGECN
jgi:hypothetical protein